MPKGWTELPFTEVFADVSAGQTKTLARDFLVEGDYPLIDQGQSAIGGYTNDGAALSTVELPVIIFGDHTRALKFVDFPFGVGADGVKILRPKIDADARFLYRYLKSVRIEAAGYDRHFKYLKRISVPLPPIEEQRRIAAVLDQADELRAKRRAALALLDTLTESIFLDMFGDPVANPMGWARSAISELVDRFEAGKSIETSAGDRDARYWVIKVSAITSGYYRPEEVKPIPAGYSPPPGHFVRRGDLLFSRANTEALVGASALVDVDSQNQVLSDKIWRFVWKAGAPVLPEYVWQTLQAPRVREAIGGLATGTSGSMKNVSQAKLATLQISIPPLVKQRVFVDRFHSVRSSVWSCQGLVDT